MKKCFFVVFIIMSQVWQGHAQKRPDHSITKTPYTALWMGTYAKFRLSEKFFWDAQFHYRRESDADTRYVGRMSKIYNRHAINYLPSKNFSMSLGPVLRLNFTPEPGNPEYERIVLEPRIWHEYLFAMPFPRFMVYHRLRIEHRWSRSNRVGSEWIFRNRYRYKFYMYIPINNTQLTPGTFYFTPDVEVILQSGKPIIDAPLEDVRLNPSIGYIANPRTKYTVGMMYTTGQSLEQGYKYSSRWVLRMSVYLSLDFRKMEAKIPKIRFDD